MFEIVLAATVTFVTPTLNGHRDSVCVADSTHPVSDLARAYLIGQRRYAAAPETLQVKAVTVPGVFQSMSFDDRGEVWTVWVVVADRAGNFSCASDPIGVNLVADVSDSDGVTIHRYSSHVEIVIRGDGGMSVDVYSITGRREARLYSGHAYGYARVRWRPPTTGVYYVAVVRGNMRTAKLITWVQ
jgi:hypothetical protein